MAITASKLRANIYRILDQVIETGVPVEIERRGKVIRLVAEKAMPKLARLPVRKGLKGDPEALVHIDWSKHWKP